MCSLVPLIPQKIIGRVPLNPHTQNVSTEARAGWYWCLGNLFPLKGARFLLPFITLHASEISKVSWLPPLLTFFSIFILLKIS